MECKCNDAINIQFSREHEGCMIPSKRFADAGMDVYCDPCFLENGFKVIKPLETIMIPTGIRAIVPPTHYLQVAERGSTGVKAMKYGAGIIDSSYRGIINVVITNCNNVDIVLYDDKNIKDPSIYGEYGAIYYPISKGIAQLLLLPVPKIKITEITPEEVLSNKTERMEGKLGSSGK